jgi:putative aldouronate transport system substrate-binding protein
LKKRSLMILVLLLVVTSSISFANKKEIDKPKKIVAFLDTVVLKNSGQEQFCEEFKKQTGIELVIIKPEHNQYFEKLRLTFAAGEFPDVVEISEQDYCNYANEGAFIDLGPYIKKSAVSKKIDKQLFEGVKVGGKVYGYPTQIGTGPLTYVRKDWLDNLGLKVPTTWDEFYKVLKAFTYNDPDKNGKKDTYGITSSGSTDSTKVVFSNNFYRDFFLNSSSDWELKNGKWVDGFSQPEFKGALARLQKVYKEGLIDPEIFTNQTTTCREKFTSGKCGFFAYWYGIWNQKLDQDLQKKLGAQGAKMIPIPALKGGFNEARVPAVTAITSKSKCPAAVFKYFIEYMHDAGSGEMLFTHGVENVNWTKKDGVYTILPDLVEPKKPFDKVFMSPEVAIPVWSDPFKMDERVINSRDVFMKNYRQASLPPMPEIRSRLESQINNLRNEIFGKVLTGGMSVEQGLVEYKKRAKEIGLDNILAAMNQ